MQDFQMTWDLQCDCFIPHNNAIFVYNFFPQLSGTDYHAYNIYDMRSQIRIWGRRGSIAQRNRVQSRLSNPGCRE